MPLTANITETLLATGDWQLIATEGDVLVSSDKPLVWAMNGSAVTGPDATNRGHPFEQMAMKNFIHSATIPAAVYYWIKANLKQKVTATATNPA